MRTMTAMSYRATFCWYSSFLSAVRKTSNKPLARERSSPLLKLFQPISATVWARCPGKTVLRRYGSDSSSKSRIGVRQQGVFRELENLHSLFPGHGGEVREKDVEAVTCLEMVDESLDGHPGSLENQCPAHHLGGALYGLGQAALGCHAGTIHRTEASPNIDSPHEAPGPGQEVGEPRSLGGHPSRPGAGHLRGELGGRQRVDDRVVLSGRRAGARRLGGLGGGSDRLGGGDDLLQLLLPAAH